MWDTFPRVNHVRWDRDIKAAVNLWWRDPKAAEEKYGNISKWDVSRVTDMDSLFWWNRKFNGDISAWNVSSMTTMQRMFRGVDSSMETIWYVGRVGEL
jgi:hypothetical protein